MTCEKPGTRTQSHLFSSYNVVQLLQDIYVKDEVDLNVRHIGLAMTSLIWRWNELPWSFPKEQPSPRRELHRVAHRIIWNTVLGVKTEPESKYPGP